VNKTFRIPLDLLKELEYLAQKENVSPNKLVVQCCQYALDNITTNNDDVPQQ
jgi:hypothetical protein